MHRSGSPEPWTSYWRVWPLTAAWGIGGAGSLCEPARGVRQGARVAGLGQAVQGQDADAEVVQAVAADDRVARDAGLAAAHGDLAGRLALERLLVDRPLAGDDEGGPPHARVEAQDVQHERRAGHELRARAGPEAARQAAGGAGHRDAARVARQRGR